MRRVVITGGPGAGKSSVYSALLGRADGRFCGVPEVATLMFRHVFPRVTSELERQVVQQAIFNVQRSLEEIAEARRGPGQIVLCDRGSADGAAYWPASLGDFFAAHHTTHEAELGRYDAVLFLETGAAGGLSIREGNEVRVETDAEAVAIDARLLAIWSGHPRFHRVGCRQGFADKLAAALEVVDGWLS